jgi:hypothetical protein
LPAAPPPSVTVVTDVSQIMFNPAGIRIRRLLVAVIVAVEESVTVSVLAVAAACPTVKLWFAAEESMAAVTPPDSLTNTSVRSRAIRALLWPDRHLTSTA